MNKPLNRYKLRHCHKLLKNSVKKWGVGGSGKSSKQTKLIHQYANVFQLHWKPLIFLFKL